ncbi:MAG: TonB-dependent siderophore receptor, partial [bacterium]
MFTPYEPRGRTSVGLLPPNFTLSDDQGRNDNDKQLVWLSLETEIMQNWALRLVSTATWWDHYVIDLLPLGFNADDRTMPRLWRSIANDDFSFVNAIDQVIDFELGTTDHEVLLISQGGYFRGYTFRIDDRNQPLLDVFNPVYSYRGPVDPLVRSNTVSRSESWSISGQDHVRFWEDRLQIVAGARYDWYRTKTDNNLTRREGPDNRGNSTTYKFGLLYQPIEELSLYYNYAETFLPVFGANPDGQVYRPQEGIIDEVGVKTAWLGGRLTSSVAAFKLDNTNLLRPDPDPTRASLGF